MDHYVMFVDPCGGDDCIRTPTYAQIAERLNLGREYWQNPIGSGFGCFEYIQNQLVVETLGLTTVSNSEFFVVISRAGGMGNFLAVNELNTKDSWIEILDSGEQTSIPAILFHPADRVLDLVMEFCNLEMRFAQELPNALTWVRNPVYGGAKQDRFKGDVAH